MKHPWVGTAQEEEEEEARDYRGETISRHTAWLMAGEEWYRSRRKGNKQKGRDIIWRSDTFLLTADLARCPPAARPIHLSRCPGEIPSPDLSAFSSFPYFIRRVRPDYHKQTTFGLPRLITARGTEKKNRGGTLSPALALRCVIPFCTMLEPFLLQGVDNALTMAN